MSLAHYHSVVLIPFFYQGLLKMVAQIYLSPYRNTSEDIFTGGVFLSLKFCFRGNRNHLLAFLTIKNFIENFKYILFQSALFVGF